ncbi:selenide, water dikinase SelD [Thiospirochaeta perfilievii]|uniref:Selenide, water dikinase n=1 Tax=Thiospirochaeta perfilievii TaxID=252967 RepID=A0A5C1Q8M6_9SPIO|nr:selenide, water dikinase SelD [Thiospirochaeta perfilievii]QEN04443.1 selenide, water dikinase SelD [Thiospirochaeta perfilievii]
MDDIKLTTLTKFSGCGAKLGPGLLDKALCGLTQPIFPNLMVDFTTSDDAGVYKINDEQALVNTLDFFPPIVDDPYAFGQIATANALSDVYAMGATPITAMSIVGFPLDKADISVLRKITEGCLDKLKEANVPLVGGHSIQDSELKFGVSVSGLVHPDKVLVNNKPELGEVVILTKPIGTGTINTALKKGWASQESINASMESMVKLNKYASEIIQSYPVKCCTDVTGFGLVGHSCEMILDSEVGLTIDFKSLKLLPGVNDSIEKGAIPGGTRKNLEFRGSFVENLETLSDNIKYTLFDPQTSGGLLFTIKPEFVDQILEEMESNNIDAFIVGEVTDNKETIIIK